MGKTKVECKKLEALTDKQKCVFCHTRDMDIMKYGAIYMYKNIITHYYCLLLSSNMEQNGRDSDGILGFLPNDINKEVKRGVRLFCSYCRTGGATLGCAVPKCKVVFHLPCGLKHSTLHQFFGEFRSFCAKHRPVQKISEKILAESSKGAMCGICYEKVVPRPIHETLWAPCCQKSAFFHRDCVQQLATSAGYFFKCPLCNNIKEFQEAMKEYGIFIPEQDASWESVPQAYQELLVRHETCDSAKCICPSGRRTNVQGTRWELILCKFCGSQGIHIGCGRLKWKAPSFECDICSGTPPEEQESNSRNYNGNRHRLSGRTADIHPSVSADREGEDGDSDSSDDSTRVTITNSNKKLVCSGIETTVSTTPPPLPPEKKSKQDKTDRKSARSTIVVDDIPDTNNSMSIVIDDSDDDDIEVVSVSKSDSGCLKTLAGLTIPVVHLKEKHKRPRVEGDIKVLPDEIVDITIQMQNPSKKPKPVSPPPIEEVVYSLPTPQPSTSAAYSAPSTSFAPPPDFGRFVLVDPNNLRPEDLPPGTMLYRSVQPALNVPQMQVQPQLQPQMQSQMSSNVPMQQLGSSHADTKHPNLRKYRTRNINYIRTQHLPDCTEKSSRSLKCNCPRRRRRRSDNNRLNPKVMLSPLKCRISNGHYEILFARRNLGFSSLKRKIPLPSRPMKKMKSFHESSGLSSPKRTKKYQRKNEKPKNPVSDSINVTSVKTELSNFLVNKISDNSVDGNEVKSNKLPMKNVFISQKIKVCLDNNKKKTKNCKNTNDLGMDVNLDEREPVKVQKANKLLKMSHENKSNYKKDRKRTVQKFDERKYKKIDCYLTKFNSNTTTQASTNTAAEEKDLFPVNLSRHREEENVTVKTLIDDIVDIVFKKETKSIHFEETIVSDHSDKNRDLHSRLKISSQISDIGNVIKEESSISAHDTSDNLEPVNNPLKITKNVYSEDSFNSSNSSSLKSDSQISDIGNATNDGSPVNDCGLSVDIELESSNKELKIVEEPSYVSNDSSVILSCNDVSSGHPFKEESKFLQREVLKIEKLENAEDNSDITKSSNAFSIDSEVNIVGLNRDSRKCLKNSHTPRKQMQGFFPKIKLAHRSKPIKRKNLDMVKNNTKKSTILEILTSGDVKVTPKKKTNCSPKNCFANKRSVIDSYFMSVKKDALHAPTYSSENPTDIDTSGNKNFSINDDPYIFAEEHSGFVVETRNLNKSNNSEKKPLMELHCNVIPELR